MAQLKIGLVAIAMVMLVMLFSVFVVDQREKAIVLRLGEVVRLDVPPGIHFKLPFIDSVRKIDSRILTLESEPEEYLTVEKKNLLVDSYVKWRIIDVAKYYKAMGGDERKTEKQLGPIIKDGLRAEFGKRMMQDAVSGERSQIMDTITQAANVQVAPFGIEVVDVRVKRIELPTRVSDSVYQRMEAERARIAKDFRSRGGEDAERVRADADKQRDVTLAEAYRDAQKIKGEGDAKASEIYAKAYGKNPEFYAMYQSLKSYRNMFNSKNDVMVMEPDSEFFKYFKSSGGK
ncbi:MAG: protease modulator HflC [Gammaproteobacteria bacterium]|nr:protease modulator HflC [Gammaproteobacteria bacterium]